jgi:hypothetical protein
MKRTVFYFLTFMFFVTAFGCSGSVNVGPEDISGTEIVTIRGCEVLISKSYQTRGDTGYGYMGMVKVDCDCVFTK